MQCNIPNVAAIDLFSETGDVAPRVFMLKGAKS